MDDGKQEEEEEGYINQSINQFNSGDVAHTRTRETDEQTESSRLQEEQNTFLGETH